MRVLYASYEVAPFLKVGGLGDVAGSLPKALLKYGVDVAVVMPFYQKFKMDASRRSFGAQNSKFKKLKDGFYVDFAGKREKISVWEGKLPNSNVPIYFLENEKYFAAKPLLKFTSEEWIYTFSFFNLALTIGFLLEQKFGTFDIVHLNDWHTALTIKLAKSLGVPNIKTVLTIHNLAYQGKAKDLLFKKFELPVKPRVSLGKVNLLREGIENTDVVTTVSPSYGREILTKKFACGLQKELLTKKPIYGILNGLDILWNPVKDSYLTTNYDLSNWQDGKLRNKRKLLQFLKFPLDVYSPLFGFVARINEQKGVPLIISSLESLFKKEMIRVVLLGVGNKKISAELHRLEEEFPDNIRFVEAFDEELAHLIYGGSDFFLVPSVFEPCGLTQMIAMKYGTLPIGFNTGGLRDTIVNFRNGFLFKDYSKEAFLVVIKEAVFLYLHKKEEIIQMVERAMKEDFSWEKSAEKYGKLYEKVIRDT